MGLNITNISCNLNIRLEFTPKKFRWDYSQHRLGFPWGVPKIQRGKQSPAIWTKNVNIKLQRSRQKNFLAYSSVPSRGVPPNTTTILDTTTISVQLKPLKYCLALPKCGFWINNTRNNTDSGNNAWIWGGPKNVAIYHSPGQPANQPDPPKATHPPETSEEATTLTNIWRIILINLECVLRTKK